MSKTQSKLGVTIPETLACCCWIQIWYFYSELYPDGAFKYHTEGCGSVSEIVYQKYNTITEVWDTIPGTDPGFESDPTIYYALAIGAQGPGIYRVHGISTECCPTYSNILEAYGPV